MSESGGASAWLLILFFRKGSEPKGVGWVTCFKLPKIKASSVLKLESPTGPQACFTAPTSQPTHSSLFSHSVNIYRVPGTGLAAGILNLCLTEKECMILEVGFEALKQNTAPHVQICPLKTKG